jgi:hypothetical protein
VHGSISTSRNLLGHRRRAGIPACSAARTLSKPGQERSPFQRMDNVFGAMITVLKAEIDRCEDSAAVFSRVAQEFLAGRF